MVFDKTNGHKGKRLKRLLLFIFAMTLVPGCIERINFDVNRQGNKLVVDGKILDKSGPYTLKLSRTAEEEKISDPLSGAEVTIYNDQGQSERYFETEPGKYLLLGNIVQGKPGRTYFIEINLPDGSTYRSDPETMPKTIASDSTYYQFDTTSASDEVVRVFTDTEVPSTENPLYLKWNVEETFKFSEYDFPDWADNPPRSCYVTRQSNTQQILLYDGRSQSSGNIQEQEMAVKELDYTFYQRHYFNVIQFSITKDAHRYWSQVNEIINNSGTIFDAPPATVEGNIHRVDDPNQKALGYFEAARVDTSRFYLVHADIPFFISNPCNTVIRKECTNCQLFDNATREPPHYWLGD